MTADRFTTLIVGGGIMGLAVAWALARRGQRVTVLEQGGVPNPLGSSVDQHRLIRYAYGAEAGYMRMVADAYPAWERLWTDLGVRHYAETGTLILESAASDEPGADWARASAAAMAADGHALNAVDDGSARARWPMLRAGFAGGVWLAPSGGVLFAEPVVRALAAWLDARAPVVSLLTGTPVTAIDPERRRATLADGRVFEADRLVVCAGPWSGRLVPELAASVVPSRQVVGYFEPPPHLAAAWATAPMMLDIGVGDALYVVPPVRGTGLKIGRHAFSRHGDPDGERVVTASDIAALQAAASHCLAGFAGYQLSHARVCFYDVTDQERFVVRPVGAGGDVWVLAGFSGHGFKFGPLIGERVAAALCGELAADAVAQWAAGQG